MNEIESSNRIERYGTAAPIEDQKEKDTGMKTSTPSLQKNRKDDLIVFCCWPSMFWWVSFSPSASVDDAKQNKNQSESEKIRPDTTNVQRTTGAKTAPLSLVSMIVDDVCPWPLWYLSRRVKATVRPSNDAHTRRRRFILTLPATRRKPEDRSQTMTAQLSMAIPKEVI